jgi:hypothetical protein
MATLALALLAASVKAVTSRVLRSNIICTPPSTPVLARMPGRGMTCEYSHSQVPLCTEIWCYPPLWGRRWHARNAGVKGADGQLCPAMAIPLTWQNIAAHCCVDRQMGTGHPVTSGSGRCWHHWQASSLVVGTGGLLRRWGLLSAAWPGRRS